jgi:ankyrin repeat protein
MLDKLEQAILDNDFQKAQTLIPSSYCLIDGVNLFLYACWNGSTKIAKEIYATGCYDINEKYNDNSVFSLARHVILKDSGLEFLKWLIDNGLDMDCGESMDSSPMMYLLSHDKDSDQLEKIKLLLRSGANFEVPHTKNNILFSWVFKQHTKSIDTLKGILEELTPRQINSCYILTGREKECSFLMALSNSFHDNTLDAIKLAVHFGADINQKVNGKTVLMHIVDEYIHYKPNAMFIDGMTLEANQEKRLSYLKFLLTESQDLLIKNDDGYNLWEYVQNQPSNPRQKKISHVIELFYEKAMLEKVVKVSQKSNLSMKI